MKRRCFYCPFYHLRGGDWLIILGIYGCVFFFLWCLLMLWFVYEAKTAVMQSRPVVEWNERGRDFVEATAVDSESDISTSNSEFTKTLTEEKRAFFKELLGPERLGRFLPPIANRNITHNFFTPIRSSQIKRIVDFYGARKHWHGESDYENEVSDTIGETFHWDRNLYAIENSTSNLKKLMDDRVSYSVPVFISHLPKYKDRRMFMQKWLRPWMEAGILGPVIFMAVNHNFFGNGAEQGKYHWLGTKWREFQAWMEPDEKSFLSSTYGKTPEFLSDGWLSSVKLFEGYGEPCFNDSSGEESELYPLNYRKVFSERHDLARGPGFQALFEAIKEEIMTKKGGFKHVMNREKKVTFNSSLEESLISKASRGISRGHLKSLKTSLSLNSINLKDGSPGFPRVPTFADGTRNELPSDSALLATKKEEEALLLSALNSSDLPSLLAFQQQKYSSPTHFTAPYSYHQPKATHPETLTEASLFAALVRHADKMVDKHNFKGKGQNEDYSGRPSIFDSFYCNTKSGGLGGAMVAINHFEFFRMAREMLEAETVLVLEDDVEISDYALGQMLERTAEMWERESKMMGEINSRESKLKLNAAANSNGISLNSDSELISSSSSESSSDLEQLLLESKTVSGDQISSSSEEEEEDSSHQFCDMVKLNRAAPQNRWDSWLRENSAFNFEEFSFLGIKNPLNLPQFQAYLEREQTRQQRGRTTPITRDSKGRKVNETQFSGGKKKKKKNNIEKRTAEIGNLRSSVSPIIQKHANDRMIRGYSYEGLKNLNLLEELKKAEAEASAEADNTVNDNPPDATVTNTSTENSETVLTNLNSDSTPKKPKPPIWKELGLHWMGDSHFFRRRFMDFYLQLKTPTAPSSLSQNFVYWDDLLPMFSSGLPNKNLRKLAQRGGFYKKLRACMCVSREHCGWSEDWDDDQVDDDIGNLHAVDGEANGRTVFSDGVSTTNGNSPFGNVGEAVKDVLGWR